MALVNVVASMLTLLVILCASSAMAQVYSSDSGGGISCYVCQSVNSSNPACQDPFDSSQVGLSSPCNQGRRDQNGVFPARYCFKLKGIRKSDGSEVLVRRCSVDPLISSVMKSHCGSFKIATGGAQEHFDGCVAMCRFDGCNPAACLTGRLSLTLPLVAAVGALRLIA